MAIHSKDAHANTSVNISQVCSYHPTPKRKTSTYQFALSSLLCLPCKDQLIKTRHYIRMPQIQPNGMATLHAVSGDMDRKQSLLLCFEGKKP